jgi:hypothetical protein
MKTRSKRTPYAELMIVFGVLLPVSACSWANPWQKSAPAAKEGEVVEGEARREMPKVKLSRTEQQLYDRYHPMTGEATGLSDQSRDVESRLGYK